MRWLVLGLPRQTSYTLHITFFIIMFGDTLATRQPQGCLHTWGHTTHGKCTIFKPKRGQNIGQKITIINFALHCQLQISMASPPPNPSPNLSPRARHWAGGAGTGNLRPQRSLSSQLLRILSQATLEHYTVLSPQLHYNDNIITYNFIILLSLRFLNCSWQPSDICNSWTYLLAWLNWWLHWNETTGRCNFFRPFCPGELIVWLSSIKLWIKC